MIVSEFYLFYGILCQPSNYSGQLIVDKTKKPNKNKKSFFHDNVNTNLYYCSCIWIVMMVVYEMWSSGE